MTCVALSVLIAGATDYNLYFYTQKDVGSLGAGFEGTAKADRAVVDYLTGDGDSAVLKAYFNEREITHMGDVYRLFRAMRAIRLFAIPLGLLLIGAAVIQNREWTRVLSKGGMLGLALFFLPIVAIGAWAVIDFYSAFRAMHRVLFDNMLWLLSPETDLLVRIFTQEFFEQIALRLAIFCAVLAPIPPLLMLAASFLGRILKRR